jgi:hypothetical protein
VFKRDFYFWYRLVIVGVGVSWNAVLCWKPGGSFMLGLRDFVLEMLPIVALVILARNIRHHVILIAAAIIHAAMIWFATRATFVGTDPLPLAIAPLLTLFAVVPGAMLAGWILRKQSGA